MDRADVLYAVKEVCCRMAVPRRCDWQKVKRLARYPSGMLRMVQKFDWQETPDKVTVIVWKRGNPHQEEC
eukprot:12488617-Heterocapsa_arctica.AAC.1